MIQKLKSFFLIRKGKLYCLLARMKILSGCLWKQYLEVKILSHIAMHLSIKINLLFLVIIFIRKNI